MRSSRIVRKSRTVRSTRRLRIDALEPRHLLSASRVFDDIDHHFTFFGEFQCIPGQIDDDLTQSSRISNQIVGQFREAEERLARYFRFYCEQRVHQSLDYRTPAEVYRQ